MNKEEEIEIDDVYRGAVEIVEQKHETAKFVIQALHEKSEHNTKLLKLN